MKHGAVLIEYIGMLALLAGIGCITSYFVYALVTGKHHRPNRAKALFALPALGIIGFTIYALIVLN